MKLTAGHLLSGIPLSPAAEVFEPLVQATGLRLERIVSTGQATPAGEWLVQDWDEWVLLLAGEAKLLIAGEAVPRELRPDDWINIPAGVRHRQHRSQPNMRRDDTMDVADVRSRNDG
jgi:cupin 2 domain-containing protein